MDEKIVSIVFMITTLITVILFLRAGGNSILPAIVLFGWIAFQGVLSLNGFYKDISNHPFKLPILIMPMFVLILLIFITKTGRKYIDDLNLQKLTWLHIVRIPVEITLFFLAAFEQVPVLMTFEGRNFDMISGITAPIVVLLAFRNGQVNKKLLLIWNLVCLALLFNIVINAILSAPTPFQKFAFDHPNVGVFKFPYVWLPSVIVPLVLFSHLAAIRHLLKKE